MKRFMRRVAWTGAVFAILAAGALFYIRGRGVSAREQPSWMEERGALFLRSWLTPSRYKGLNNPVSASPENIAAGREHFADHCATCHANDGSGNTEMGRNFYPKAPDMRLPRTQGLTDGELFYAIQQGIPWTAMPGWAGGAEGERESWELVRFIRHLPDITADELKEMETLNPSTPADRARDREIDEFLSGPPGGSSGK